MFDSQCHLDFPELAGARDEWIADARRVGVRGWLVPGCSERQWSDLWPLRRYEGVVLAVGVHPWWAHEASDVEGTIERLGRALDEPGVVALGECGLDALRTENASLERQVELWEAQLRLARERDVPLVLHQVRAQNEFLRSIERVGVGAAGAVVHGFSGTKEWAGALVKRGFRLGVGFGVTRPERTRLREAIASVGLETCLIETDAPDQRPTNAERPHGVPADVTQVVAALARIFGVTEGEVRRTTEANARRFFGLPAASVGGST